MSSRAGKMEKQVIKNNMPEQKVKSIIVGFDIDLLTGDDVKSKTVVIEIAGVPQDLPQEFEGTVLRTAEQQFSTAVNSRTFIETFSRGHDGSDEKPEMFNLSKVDRIKVIDVKKLREINKD